jgi:hypothetical protein
MAATCRHGLFLVYGAALGSGANILLFTSRPINRLLHKLGNEFAWAPY